MKNRYFLNVFILSFCFKVCSIMTHNKYLSDHSGDQHIFLIYIWLCP